MFIKLTSSQIPAFWELYKQSLIVSKNIPKKYQQEYANKQLEKMLTGASQAWMGYEVDENGEKRIQYTMTTRIVSEEQRGIRVIYVSSLYRYGGIDTDMLGEANAAVEKWAKTQGCKAIIVEYILDVMEGYLADHGYETFLKMSRRFI